MTPSTTAVTGEIAAWPIDTPHRILRAMAGSRGLHAEELANLSGVDLEIVVEWLTEKVSERLLIFEPLDGTYRSLCQWPARVRLTGHVRS